MSEGNISMAEIISKRIPRLLKTWPLYVLTLPLFFVLHGVKENFGFILAGDFIPLILFYCVCTLLIYFVFYLLYRRKIKAGLITFLLFSIFFFYGAIQDFLKQYLPSLNRYIILLPSFFVIIIAAAAMLKKSKNTFEKLNLFVNSLLVIYVLFDLTILLTKSLFPAKDKFTVSQFEQNGNYLICKDCTKPDIYFMIFDEYASSGCLKNDFGFDNSRFDSFLVSKQFRIQKKSSGNYNFTPFSVSSILNMSYINGITPAAITIDDYARCNKLIRENEVVKYLTANGYSIKNYSIFELAGNPSPVNQDFLPLKTTLITSRTLWGRIKKDILWHLFTGKLEIKWLVKSALYGYNDYNNNLISLVKKESEKKSTGPRFIYAHFNMPHTPFYYDRNGKLIDRTKLEYMHYHGGEKNLYLEYVLYTNKRIEELVNAIQRNSKGESIIIIMGDHGYRDDANMPQHVFLQNQNAVYLPEKKYNLFYDSITGVNQFRVLFNTIFKQNIPLLKDSTSFLKDAH